MLAKPNAGQTVECSVQHGQVYLLGFDSSEAFFDRSGDDLRIAFDDGSFIILREFFPLSLSGDFFLETDDGNLLSSRSVADSFSLDLDEFAPGAADHVCVADTESIQPSQSSSSYGDDEALFLAQSLFEARTLEGLSAQDTLAVSDGDYKAVVLRGGDGGVFDHYADTVPLTSDYVMAEQSSVSQARMEKEGVPSLLSGLDLSDEPALFSRFGHGEPDSDIITPRMSDEPSLTPFLSFATEQGSDLLASRGSSSGRFSAKSSREVDLLLLEDLLDTTMPEQLTAETDHVPAFEELFQSTQDDGFSFKVDPFVYTEADIMNTVADSAADGSEQLLLAFLRMGSF